MNVSFQENVGFKSLRNISLDLNVELNSNLHSNMKRRRGDYEYIWSLHIGIIEALSVQYEVLKDTWEDPSKRTAILIVDRQI